MKLFSRLTDIVNSNLSAMLDKAENPEKMLKLIITEMQETLLMARANAKVIISDKKTLERHLKTVRADIVLWQKRAEKAVAKQRDDLATQALHEKQRLEKLLEVQTEELKQLEIGLNQLEHDVSKLQSKLDEVLAKRNAMNARCNSAVTTIKVRKQINHNEIEQAINRFEQFERKVDALDAEVDAMDLGVSQNLGAQIDSLNDDSIIAELKQMKQKIHKKTAAAS